MQISPNEINSCRSCSSKNLKTVLDLGLMYLSDFVEKSTKKPPKYPLTLVICQNCSLVQLLHTTPPSKLYTKRYGYKSGVNNTMRAELKDIVDKSARLVSLKKGNFVIDIGANDGTLLSFYPKGIKKIAVEPVGKFAKESKKYADIVINDYFSSKNLKQTFARPGLAKIVTAIAMFYDINDPNAFLSDIKKILSPCGIFIIQQNYLPLMLSLNAFDNIVHEHLEYYSLTSLENLLNKHGLRVFDVKEREINGGSFRTYICFKDAKYKTSKAVFQMRKKEGKLDLDNQKTYQKFAENVRKIRKSIRKYIEKEAKSGRTIYIYGASTRGNTLIQYLRLNQGLIPFAAERNPQKWGKYIGSVGIPIISEEEARAKMPDNMFVLPWFFSEEILKRESDFLKRGGKLIFPLPELKVYAK